MRKKSSYWVLPIVLLFLTAQAEADCGTFDGFYVGAGGGVATNMADAGTKTAAQINTLFSPDELLLQQQHNSVFQMRPWGEIFGGWGRQCGYLYLGGRFGVSFSDFSPKAQAYSNSLDPDPNDQVYAPLEDTLKTKMWTTEYTLDFKPGWVFCQNTMLYGIFGAAINKERLEGTSHLLYLGGGSTADDLVSVRQEKTRGALRLGIGIEQKLKPCLSLYGSYVYTTYPQLRGQHSQIYQTTPPRTALPHSGEFSTKPSKQVASLGLSYFFSHSSLGKAEIYGPSCRAFDGFYVGAGGGVANNMTDAGIKTDTQIQGFVPELMLQRQHNSVFQMRPWGEIFGGWGRQCGYLYLGGRFGVNFSDFSPTAHAYNNSLDPNDEQDYAPIEDTLKTKMRTTEYTLDFKPGWVFCQKTMLYGIFGAAFNKERLEGTSHLLYFLNQGFVLSADNLLTLNKEKTMTGFRIGLGLEQKLKSCLSLYGSYVYTTYPQLKARGTQIYQTTPPLDSLNHSGEFSTKPSKQVFSLGLTYYF